MSPSDVITEPRVTVPRSVAWIGPATGYLRLIDQTRLPSELVYLDCRDSATVFEAIRSLRVRGAPAIGIAAAYGVVLVAQGCSAMNLETFRQHATAGIDYLATSRPTAVNLFWALDRLRLTLSQLPADGSPATWSERLLAEAHAIRAEDAAMCHAIGSHGASLLAEGTGVLTHCNAGGLATAEYGTALAVIFTAHEQGRRLRVFVDETRPLLQGARLTAWELQQHGVPATLICDSMAAQVMREGRIQAVVVGADRIAANGDTANKIGTYGVALLAAAHGIPFYVAAPTSTFDLTLATGEGIPIEQRSASEVSEGFGRPTAPAGMDVYNPAFDVTPARLIRAIICERGVIDPVTPAAIRARVA